jgi:hypothetical protein
LVLFNSCGSALVGNACTRRETSVLVEASVDRFLFACRRCAYRWEVDYRVRHVDDGHGWSWDCYSRDGCRVTAPTAPGVVRCPGCEGHAVRVEFLSTRDDPDVRTPARSAP